MYDVINRNRDGRVVSIGKNSKLICTRYRQILRISKNKTKEGALRVENVI